MKNVLGLLILPIVIPVLVVGLILWQIKALRG